ncbi:MAG: hypothetical protein ABI294_02425 [Casimicrobiaceae bacterium]
MQKLGMPICEPGGRLQHRGDVALRCRDRHFDRFVDRVPTRELGTACRVDALDGLLVSDQVLPDIGDLHVALLGAVDEIPPKRVNTGQVLPDIDELRVAPLSAIGKLPLQRVDTLPQFLRPLSRLATAEDRAQPTVEPMHRVH